MMKILKENPPNYGIVSKTFDLSGKKVVFTYGDTIYNPGGYNIPPDLIVHEEIHSKQQGSEPGKWWDRYLTDVIFRLTQELEAYHSQYKFVDSMSVPKRVVKNFLTKLALDLSGPMYGNIITAGEAEIKIKSG